MSEQTKTAMDAAIAAHVNDEGEGALVTGYVMQVAHFNSDTLSRGTTGYMREFAEDQAYHAGRGLAEMLTDYYSNPQWVDEDDEDDD